MSELKDKTAKGLLWGGLGNGAMQVIGILLGLVMLNILSPADYGKIAVLLIYTNIATNLQDSGLSAALINKKEPTHEEYNSVFWFNILVSSVLYLILWFAAPYIAAFNHDESLTPLARFLFCGFVINSFGTVQRAYLNGHLKLKQVNLIALFSVIMSNSIGVVMALMGYAYWGLAAQTVLFVTFIMICDWFVSPWRPSLHIDLRPAAKMFGFSSKLLVTNLFNQLNTQVFSFLLGRFYNTRTVGYYSNARKWNDIVVNTIQGMMNGVSQPVLAQVVDDDERYRRVFRKMLRFVCFVTFPCMLGLALVAKEFILITVSAKWIESVPMLQLLCIYGAFYPVTMLYSYMAISRGKSGINMFCTITLCILIWAGLLLMYPYGVYSMIVYFVVVNIAWLLVWQWFAWRMVRLSLWAALTDIMPFFLLAAGVMACTHYVTLPIENLYLALVSKIAIAFILYTGLSYLSGAQIMRETLGYLTHLRSKS